MTQTRKILAIDDDNISQKFIMRAVNDAYEMHAAQNGADGLKAAEKLNPDLILLDIEMPGANGYEVCKTLRSIESVKHIPIIFLTGRTSLEDRIRGFEAGADDYVAKPFEPKDLLAKIAVLLKYRKQNVNFQEQITDAQKTAFIAMTGSSELGQAMSLVEQSYSINSYEALAQHLFSFTNRMQLNCSVLIKIDGTFEAFSSSGNISPLEIELLNTLQDVDRFHDFGKRTQINYPNISLLIKNMPVEDMERYGRIKDLMPPILGAFDAKIRSLSIELAIREQNIELNTSFHSIKNTLRDLGRSLQENSKGGQLILSNMLNDLVQSLPGMGLESDQEDYILDRIEFAINTISGISEAGDSMSESFEMLIAQLQNLVEKQNALVESSSLRQQSPQVVNHDSNLTNIDLF